MPIVYLALGSNLNRPHWQLRRAVRAIAATAQTKLLTCSSIYRSSPIGPAIQPDYLNAVVAVQCTLRPLALLTQTQAIEKQQGRKRRQRWGPRTLDIDILLFANHQLRHSRLIVPHPRLTQRRFAMEPLLEIAPHAQLPDGRLIQTFANQLAAGVQQEKITLTSLSLNS
ncbi:MAG: 2-amino-4-hydroxy-6-hydroxymethyldihydropteridine diphosphokinase [Pseudomonadales bacterium]